MPRSERRRRTELLVVRLLPAEKDALTAYSKDTGEPISEYVRRRVLTPLEVKEDGDG